ncbi:hypothetical protein [Pseudomonas amygdali]|uniref:hypothetical protein n=1 Tax=Pseudomonas amygdali TaxID=47877 RepID=UPI0001CC166E|nr:hypothetical protein [Pseudomonas amygdali]KWT07511.1 hypothetical protein AL041_24845 [Pseudomonas amygdali pv. aesculi]KWT19872.1 hypothetical protein AL042_26275 [Pseudomonas amygdali pv. aesculi]KWT26638.1 hypothetical protein AL044_19780 [Pseudomonas amygdali pv. aesculi]KWT27073.1 hypothetical protein AL043_16445 [Pseudomonas amygdali pv. aesculi]KWT34354.1 hypothetical protein AMC94_01705 [Pseudomonas amygdali pv. aesculi]
MVYQAAVSQQTQRAATVFVLMNMDSSHAPYQGESQSFLVASHESLAGSAVELLMIAPPFQRFHSKCSAKVGLGQRYVFSFYLNELNTFIMLAMSSFGRVSSPQASSLSSR